MSLSALSVDVVATGDRVMTSVLHPKKGLFSDFGFHVEKYPCSINSLKFFVYVSKLFESGAQRKLRFNVILLSW